MTTTVLGTRRTLAPGVELSAFRIVQEALSNAMRHAPGAAVGVLIAYHGRELALRVTNTAPDRPVAPSPGAGHGLLGMRERTAMLGGELAVGATPDGGTRSARPCRWRRPRPDRARTAGLRWTTKRCWTLLEGRA